MSTASPRFSPNALLWAVGGLTVLALAVRLPGFAASLFGDEVTSYGLVNNHGPGTIVDLVRTDYENTPPLFYLLAGAGDRLLAAPEGLRLPSLLAGVAVVPLTYLLGTMTVGRRAALFGAALGAISPFLVFYSGLARGYSLVVLLVLLSTLAMLRALDRGGALWWIAYAAASAAAMYTHYTAAFVLVAQLGWALVVHPPARPALVGVNLGAALVYLPWLPGLREDSGSPTYHYDALRHLDFSAATENLGSWAVGHPALTADLIGGEGLALLAAGLALGVVGLLLSRWGQRPSAETLLVFVLALAVPLGATLYSVLGTDILTARNLAPSWPGLALAVGAVLTAGRGWIPVAAVALYLAGVAIGTVRMQDPDNRHPDYQGVAEFIDAEAPPGTPIVELTPSGWGPQTALEAALGEPHEALPGGHPVLQLSAIGGEGWPPVARRHEFLHAGATVFSWPPSGDYRAAEQAARVGRLAGNSFFFVGFEALPTAFGEIPGGPPAGFVEALPPGFSVAEVREFPGFRGYAPVVYVFRRG